MEFNEKLQELRKSRKLTQEEVATALFVSRTAISKWESGKGYPNIESLKAISSYFDITIDQLLSSDELLTIAEADTKKSKKNIHNLAFGLLDISVLMLLVLPFFGQKSDEMIQGISLLFLTQIEPYLKVTYYAAVLCIGACGILTLAMQGFDHKLWIAHKTKLSLLLSLVAISIFVISKQPYAAMFLFAITAIKVLLLFKWK